MSEIFVKNVNALIVSVIEPQSPAALAGVEPGDHLRRINGRPILDILDYRFHAADTHLEMEIEREGRSLTLSALKTLEEDLGLTFEYDLGDKVHTCNNKCVFCFIHQQPKKMRRSLYLMDDDFRLSFMHGNYVTLTNLSTEEWARILEQRLSPLYVSVHATDPELRRQMLGRKELTPILPQLRVLADNRIDVHAQVVLCPGLNDGENLDRTLTELAAEHRSVTGKRAGVESVAIVPVGMTRYRERLVRLAPVEKRYAGEMIDQVAQHTKRFQQMIGTRFAWLGDEWYTLAGRSLPGRAHYEQFPQLEDGIGTIRLFLEDAKKVLLRLPSRVPVPLQATLVTAELPAPFVQEFAERLNRVEGVDLNVCVVKNEFFGGDIRIAGLLTATDILNQLREFPDCHEVVYVPAICLRDGELFLDDLTLEQARAQSGLDLRVTGNSPTDLARALGLIRPNAAGSARTSGWAMEITES